MSFILPAAASLVDQLDKRVLIILRDGRNLVGVVRSFDQFSNLVLEDTYERRVVVTEDEARPAVYGDAATGVAAVLRTQHVAKLTRPLGLIWCGCTLACVDFSVQPCVSSS